MDFDLSWLGHLKVHVQAHEPHDHARLSFVIEADQACLPVWRVDGHGHDKYWIPAEDLAEFNHNIVGSIEVIATYAGGPDHEPCQMP